MMRRRNFALFFSGRCISFLGNAMAPVALAFAVLQISGSASALGIVLLQRLEQDDPELWATVTRLPDGNCRR